MRDAPLGNGAPVSRYFELLGLAAQPVYPTGEVQTCGLPLLMEFRCYPSDTGLGLNPLAVALAINSSAAVDEGRKLRRLRPRTVVYGGLLTALASSATVLLLARVPFEATVNRAPGSSFVVDSDGWVRNTYLLRITNKDAESETATYGVTLDGLEGAQIVAEPVVLTSTESRTVPMVIRVPAAEVATGRSLAFDVRVRSEQGEVLLPATFLTDARVGGVTGGSR